jgi:hypothetical protein
MKTAMMLLADPTTSDGIVVIMGALVLLSRALMKATTMLLEYPVTASHQQLHTVHFTCSLFTPFRLMISQKALLGCCSIFRAL